VIPTGAETHTTSQSRHDRGKEQEPLYPIRITEEGLLSIEQKHTSSREFSAQKSRTFTGEGVPAYPANGVYLWRAADGLLWEHDGGEPLWRTGADAPPSPAYGAASDVIAAGERGAWDGGNLATAAHPVTVGDEHLHYSGGGPVYHGAIGEDTPFRPEIGVFMSIGLARMGRDRYASYSATTGGSGLVHHGPLRGTRLRVNARAPYGAVHAQVLDTGGRELPGLGTAECVAFSGDSVSGEVRWANADLAAVPAGGEIAIRFVLNEADLSGYEVTA
jgi:hypothetical protein